MTKVLIIGFDGMDYFLTKKTMGEYLFKNFKPVLRKQVTDETTTGPSWASFYTGLDKEIHGVIDYWGRDIRGSNSFREIEDYAFWNIIKESGYEVYTDNLPIMSGGFPFTSSREKDMANWVNKPTQGWTEAIRQMGFEEVYSKVRMDSFNLIEAKKGENWDLIFIQFSFLDRIGHVFSFKDEEVTVASYSLAYELADKLFELITPRYLIITSDHGFWRRRTEHHGANCAVLILNDESYQFFTKNQVFKPLLISLPIPFSPLSISFPFPFSCNLSWNEKRSIYLALVNLPLTDFFRYIFHFDYIKQTDIFDVILRMFDVDYKKPEQRIPKKREGKQLSAQDEEAIKRRLKRLGYL